MAVSLKHQIKNHPEKFAKITHCPICHCEYAKIPEDDDRKEWLKYTHKLNRISKDHILPKTFYNDDFRMLVNHMKVNNVKFMCAECNSERAFFNHCLPALIFDRLVKGDTRYYDGVPKKIPE